MMNDASFAGNNQGQPLCYLNIFECDCVYIRMESDIIVILYYWLEEKNECSNKDEYCSMVYHLN